MLARNRVQPRCAALACVLYACLLALCACNERARDARPDAGLACASCHMPQYLAAKKPLHVGVRPTACGVCHTQDAWAPSVFNHPWPLTGAHEKARCAACHRGQPPVYAGTSRLCVDCHRADFERSDFPGHASFPTTCADCHSTSAWTPAREPARAGGEQAAKRPANEHPRAERSTGASRKPSPKRPGASHGPTPETTAAPSAEATPETAPEPAPATETAPEPAAAAEVHPEDRFPISHGAHAGIRCRTCHDQGGTMGKDNTDCVQCHARAKFDAIHEGVRGYPAGSAPLNFCLRCHSSGRVRGR